MILGNLRAVCGGRADRLLWWAVFFFAGWAAGCVLLVVVEKCVVEKPAVNPKCGLRVEYVMVGRNTTRHHPPRRPPQWLIVVMIRTTCIRT